MSKSRREEHHITGFDNSTVIDGKRIAVWLAEDGWRWFVDRQGWDGSDLPESDCAFPSERAALQDVRKKLAA